VAFNHPLDFETSLVTNMRAMFSNAAAFNQPLASWKTTQVTEMGNMFKNALVFDQPLYFWDTRNVTGFADMFDGSGLSDCHKRNVHRFWGVGNTMIDVHFRDEFAGLCPHVRINFIPTTSSMLQVAVRNWLDDAHDVEEVYGGIADWNTHTVVSFQGLFKNNTGGVSSENFDTSLDKWQTSSVVTMEETFAYATNFNKPLGAWQTSRVTSLAGMFSDTHFNQNINGWDVMAVVDTAYMFVNTKFDSRLSDWHTDQITDLRHMFDNARDFGQDLSRWAMGSARNLEGMFRLTQRFNSNVGAWSPHAVTDMRGMFADALAFNQDLSAWALTGLPPVDLRDMFAGATALDHDISAWPLQLTPAIAAGMFDGIDHMSACHKNTLYRRWPDFFALDAQTAAWAQHDCCENGRAMPDILAQLQPPLPVWACGQCNEGYIMDTTNQTCLLSDPTTECTHENANTNCPVHQRYSRHCLKHHVHGEGVASSYDTFYICTPSCNPGKTIAQDLVATNLGRHAPASTCKNLDMDPLTPNQCRVYGLRQMQKTYPDMSTNLYSGHGSHTPGRTHECFFGIVNQSIYVGYHDIGTTLDAIAFYNNANTFGVLCVSAARCFTADPTSCPNGEVIPNVFPALDNQNPVCASCDPGHALDTVTHTCMACSRGKFSPGGTVGECAACPARHYQNELAQSSCTEWNRCGFGYHRAGESSKEGGVCLQCVTGMYQDTADFTGSSCTTCDMDQLSSGSASMRSQCGAESTPVFETWALAGTVVGSAAIAFAVSYLADRKLEVKRSPPTARYTPFF